MRYDVTFSTLYPIDKSVSNPGKELADWLAQNLALHGFTNLHVDSHENYAWRINGEFKGLPIFVLVGFMDDGIRQWRVVIGSALTRMQRLMRKDDTELRDALAWAIHETLDEDNRFTDIQWYDEDDQDDAYPAATPDADLVGES